MPWAQFGHSKLAAAVGAYANRRLTLAEVGKVQGRIMAETPNRTWENWLSGIIGGLRKRGHGGNVHPPCNRKSEEGNPPPTAGAPELYPNQEVKTLLTIPLKTCFKAN